MSSGAVYVYGVIRAAEAAALPDAGVEDAAVRAIEHGELAAVVSDVAGGALAAAREVRAHWRVLEAVAEKATIVPVRFGTVLEGDEVVREELLGAHASSLASLLQELAGRVQVTVKGSYVGEDLMRGVVTSSPTIAALRDRLRRLPEDAGYAERIQLGELVAAEVERLREHDTARALARLEPHAVAARAEAVGKPDAAFNLSFLVERAGMDAFSAAVTGLIGELGDRIAVRYVGPLAPYSFADLELEIEAA